MSVGNEFPGSPGGGRVSVSFPGLNDRMGNTEMLNRLPVSLNILQQLQRVTRKRSQTAGNVQLEYSR